MSEIQNPFEGMKRRRLPAIHLIASVQGGIPLHDALAGHLFMGLHDRLEHNCLIPESIRAQKAGVASAQTSAGSSDALGLGTFFGAISTNALLGEEWSYLPDEEPVVFSLALQATVMVEQVQRWICEGQHGPRVVGYGPLVVRPEWAICHYSGSKYDSLVQKPREYVARLVAEVKNDRRELGLDK